MDTPPFMKSWVDLTKSNPPTPPHPLQKQQDPPNPPPCTHLDNSGATSGAVTSAAASDLPPPLPHVTSSPFMVPQSLDSSMLLQSSSAVPMTSASWAEQHDSVGPLGFGNGEEYLRLLKEAQREGSNQSSALVSLSSSRRDSPRGSPKSPPNSPNTELTADGRLEQLGTVYINYYSKDSDAFVRVEKNTDTDWVWDWSSRPDQLPPKEWHFSHPGSTASSSCSGGTPVGSGTASAAAGTSRKTRPASCARLPAVGCNLRRGASLRRLKVGESALFSRGVLYTLFLTNVLSFLLGTGIGVWLSKRTGSQLTVATLPFN
ncbi:BCL2/adenovirus E1B 19 kDa protein-interacting protein 3 isoform X2 [Hyalella azteca]|uniref:BCL2/adenovirus E1B 19 kDa protein-interacting protein 3 isoform X2 n=1 Tax=Hyalella azteca TaxID=294128 RepID=A0A8B7PEF2_HYAAZ|nr:BCL2/adenovirus E1B 19 kDa protein-interacting protein 3 isoform X2 [Hyalella azteca]